MRAFSRALVAVALATAATFPAGAQSLQRVTVKSFALSTDNAHPRAGATFHIVLTLRLRERLSDIENVQLPLLAGLSVLGDTRSISTGAGGTLYSETLSVAARGGGTLTIAPATFDAVDARDGKPKEYSTNSLAIDVTGGARSQRGAVVAAEILVSVGVALVVLGVFLTLSMRRRDRAEPPAAAEPEAPPPPPGDPLALARERLERDPTRMGALHARGLVRQMVGANDGETLADVIAHCRKKYPKLIGVLSALERAAFTYDDDVHRGVEAALAALREVA